MPFSLRRLSRYHWLALFILGLTGVTVVAVSKWPRNPTSLAAGSLAANAPPKDISFYVVQTVLRPEGFEITEFNLPKGTFRIILLNRTGLPDLVLQFSKVVGNKEKVKDFTFDTKKRFKLEDTIDLTPGNYLLEVVGHPEWICRLSVANN